MAGWVCHWDSVRWIRFSGHLPLREDLITEGKQSDSGNMAIMLSGPDPYPPVVALLDSVSPYGSRRLTVEFDGTTTAAYLRDETTVIAATWIANHVRAPRTTDPERINAGQAPVMPVGRTRHPRGRPPLDPATLQALWFEEGDGVALLERGTLLAVIPGWADSSRGMPGYSRDVIGQTPFAWALEDAIDGLGPRVERAAEFWKWRNSAGGWAQFQSAALGHLTSRLGPGAHYWDGAPGKRPIDRHLRAALRGRPAVHDPVHHRDERAADAGRRAGRR